MDAASDRPNLQSVYSVEWPSADSEIHFVQTVRLIDGLTVEETMAYPQVSVTLQR